MSIFYEPGTGLVPEEFFVDGGVVEIPHSVLLSSLDAETIAETYGVAVEDILMRGKNCSLKRSNNSSSSPRATGWIRATESRLTTATHQGVLHQGRDDHRQDRAAALSFALEAEPSFAILLQEESVSMRLSKK